MGNQYDKICAECSTTDLSLPKNTDNNDKILNYESTGEQAVPVSKNRNGLANTDDSKSMNNGTRENFTINYESGAVYHGGSITRNGRPIRQGQGRQTWPDGSYYEGTWQNDYAEGLGRFYQVNNGAIYQGQIHEGKCQGKGKLYTKDEGLSFEGHFVANAKEGFGIEIMKGQYRYEGNFVNSVKHGKGKLILEMLGCCYEGDFIAGLFHGQGKYQGADFKYVGEWKEGKMEGQGNYYWHDGRSYVGQYQNGQKNGFGVYTYRDGRKYKGQWLNGVQHGMGTIQSKSGSMKGQWENGHLVKQQNDAK